MALSARTDCYMATFDLGKIKIPIKLCFWHKYTRWMTEYDYGWYRTQRKTCKKCGIEKQRISFKV